jgi:hypothetical protein
MAKQPLFALLLIAFGAQHATAAPVDSLFSDESVEVRADERLFTLMLLFNGMGWSETAEYGAEPLKSPVYKGMRKDLIGKLSSYRERYLPNRVLNRAKRFVVQHPAAIEDYIEATLHISRSPEFKMGSSLPPRLAKLKGLAGLLKGAWRDARVKVLMSRYKDQLIEAQQGLLSSTDKRTGPLVRMLKAKGEAVRAKVDKATGGDDMADLFGSSDGDAGDEGGTATADDATAELEQIVVGVSPFWRRDKRLLLRVNGRFELIFGGQRGDGVTVAQHVALVRLRAAAGIADKPVTDAQTRASWALVSAATGRQGPDQMAPYPACISAVADWKKLKVALTASDQASRILASCEAKGN